MNVTGTTELLCLRPALVKEFLYPQITQILHGLRVICGWNGKESRELRPNLYTAGFDWYLREIISANELAGTGLDHVIEENLADRVVAVAWITVVKNGKESCVKLIVENRVSCLPDGAAETGSVAYDLKTSDVELGVVLRIKRWIVN